MIEFRNVSKVYANGTKALSNIDLRIKRGEFVFIVGSSGAGKSTFLKTIMREEVPSSGTVMINNYDLTRMDKKEIPYFRRTLGIVFQDFRLIPNMTVYDNVAFAMRVIGASEKDIRKRVPYVLTLVGLEGKARSMPNEISGGEQQRVSLARALVNNANTIIADEPTGNIDPEMSYEIMELFNHINENGTTIIMVTHEHELVRQFNHRIVVIDDGRIVSDMSPEEVASYNAKNPSQHNMLHGSGMHKTKTGIYIPKSSMPVEPSAPAKKAPVVQKETVPVYKKAESAKSQPVVPETESIDMQNILLDDSFSDLSSLDSGDIADPISLSGIDYSKYFEDESDMGGGSNE